jgi:hypothetical protein
VLSGAENAWVSVRGGTVGADLQMFTRESTGSRVSPSSGSKRCRISSTRCTAWFQERGGYV